MGEMRIERITKGMGGKERVGQGKQREAEGGNEREGEAEKGRKDIVAQIYCMEVWVCHTLQYFSCPLLYSFGPLDQSESH